MNRSIRFRGGNNYVSNFYVCRIRVWGREFHTVESAYQWKKCVHHKDWKTADNMIATRTGLQAKYLSRSIREKVEMGRVDLRWSNGSEYAWEATYASKRVHSAIAIRRCYVTHTARFEYVRQ